MNPLDRIRVLLGQYLDRIAERLDGGECVAVPEEIFPEVKR